MNNSVMKGLTLVELMIALALSSFLAIGIIQIYLDSRQTDDMGGALARIQETGRAALDIITKDLRSMGYLGCLDPKNLSTSDVDVVALNAPLTDITLNGLRGFEVESGGLWADGTEFDGSEIEQDAVIDSDVIAIQRVTSASEEVVQSKTTASMITLKSNGLDISENDLVLVANCKKGYLFRISQLITNESNDEVQLEINDSSNESNSSFEGYSSTDTGGKSIATAMKFMSNAYFVADSGRQNATGAPVYSLYRQRDLLVNSGTSSFVVEELLEGVETLQVLYGERLNGDRLRYVPANTSGLDMRNVESVRIGILVSSTNEVQQANDMQSYLLPGGEVVPESNSANGLTHPVDRRIRRTFSTTIQLRNRPNVPDSI